MDEAPREARHDIVRDLQSIRLSGCCCRCLRRLTVFVAVEVTVVV